MLKETVFSCLVVSANEKINAVIDDLLPGSSFNKKLFVADVQTARRTLLEKDFDIVIINTPLPDEFGADFAMDIADKTNSGILLMVKAELFDDISAKTDDVGILTVGKPTTKPILKQTLNLLCATRQRLRKLEKKNQSFEEKMAEIRVVNHAKWLLIENLKITEAEAHKYIEKEAMNNRRARIDVANEIIKKYEK